ncbi:hypothetical protein [uncultured Nonlabens sp.]|uniref:hypothetical protein n=1 Tax=uncultured Nonlabens sp. TaxID=859306 RepID=UPI00262716DC|nr:hypothetical protein [uncultured Nonlabens sp.]
MERRLSNALGILTIISAVFYGLFFSMQRKEFSSLLIIYVLLFGIFGAFTMVLDKATKRSLNLFPDFIGKRFYGSPLIGGLFLIGLILRFLLIDNTPHLSQDFFRFIWDGHQLINGFNPYLYLPDDVISSGASHIPNATILHSSMGGLSSGLYTNYPPLNQLFFAVAAWLGGDSILASIIWMRVFLILADVGIFIYGVKFLRLLGKSEWLIGLYYLNPFTIIELTGNLHWEGVMAFFLLAAIYHLLKSQKVQSVLFMGSGILLKLLPVMALPLLLRRLKFKSAVVYYLSVLVVVIAGFSLFVSEQLLDNYAASVGLWFGKFEFNGSIYYLVRYVGFKITGYNIIETAGKILPLFTLLIILLISFIRKNEIPEILISSILFSFFTYLMFSTTVHPWYLTIPLLFSIFTKYRFMLVWSCTVFLSYYAYSNTDFVESSLLLTIEYVLVLIMFIFDLYNNRVSLNKIRPIDVPQNS